MVLIHFAHDHVITIGMDFIMSYRKRQLCRTKSQIPPEQPVTATFTTTRRRYKTRFVLLWRQHVFPILLFAHYLFPFDFPCSI